MLEKTITNNKANIYIYSDYVLKDYINKERNSVDLKNLLKLNEYFQDFEHKGWRFQCVKILGGSKEDGIKMNRISGVPMIDDKQFSSENYYLAGVWFGYFHSLGEQREDKKVMIFDDYTFANIFIDYEQRIVTGMDLGSNAFVYKSRFYDIIKFFFVAQSSFFKFRLKYSKKCIKNFVAGYNIFAQFNFDKKEFNQLVSCKFNDIKKDPWWTEAYGKMKFKLFFYSMLALFRFFLIPTLNKIK